MELELPQSAFLGSCSHRCLLLHLKRMDRTGTTLCIDVGGSTIKAAVLDANSVMLAGPVSIPTLQPCGPEQFLQEVLGLVSKLPAADRVSMGFTGEIRNGRVLRARRFHEAEDAPAHLEADWEGFELEQALGDALRKPTRVTNDANMAALAVCSGSGLKRLELVVTLGSGVGTAFVLDGELVPHMNFSSQPFLDGETYSQQLGELGRQRLGNEAWNNALVQAIKNFRLVAHLDHIYIGGETREM